MSACPLHFHDLESVETNELDVYLSAAQWMGYLPKESAIFGSPLKTTTRN